MFTVLIQEHPISLKAYLHLQLAICLKQFYARILLICSNSFLMSKAINQLMLIPRNPVTHPVNLYKWWVHCTSCVGQKLIENRKLLSGIFLFMSMVLTE
jgi:hypothetical protein